ncbi:MAG: hypothetical protein KA191_11220 [Verrucomicrobia bacterium]|nr:hypothetical protein [Verrucomicrobiota bacterium]HOA60958.1 hypothetical protein [Verrucomicrobiota bacterium]HOF48588.1 hypothetical protein [Verrucomicrobiota bacterium]HOG86895.1 hypothetical protein [Verrucomicrobiota bacterium]HOR71632.1 hypothetical protein [Verrucomicrobiota bacterium]
MNNPDDVMRLVSPAAVLKQIAAAVPEDCRENIIIIGSLAAGYHFFGDNASLMVRTKDADCLLSPRVEAISAGVAVTERLLQQNWQFRPDAKWSTPGNESTPDDQLPAVRLNPPGMPDWFIELLTVPESSTDMKKRWVRLATSVGHFGLCSFGFLSLANYRPIIPTPLGIAIARPELMALANLLEHPEIRPETMSGLIAAREIKRSNKDLGRVLAIARLSIARNEDALLDWPGIWREAMQARFPDTWQTLVGETGAGLR